MESQTSRMVSVVIVAAGKGTRMGPDVDKLFLEVAGRPVVEHSWRRIDAASVVDEIVIVVRDGMQGAFEELAVELSAAKPYRIVVGGKERQDSVANGIAALNPAAEIVAVHDGARPCVTAELIEATVAAAREGGAAVAAQRVSDTIKESDDGRLISGHPERFGWRSFGGRWRKRAARMRRSRMTRPPVNLSGSRSGSWNPRSPIRK
jgi:2-C-methyl-D-erythritol 4-phosphate cytidylyltransferase